MGSLAESALRVADKKDWIKGAMGDWEIIIGLEVHAQISSKAKLFSGASAEYGGDQNDHVSFVDAAMPGMLPVINEFCVEQAVRTGLGLKAQINDVSVFDRKNYFYPDLPQGYQISQFKQPIVGEGVVSIDLDAETSINVGIERLHLEQDAGKSLHDQHPNMSYVDLNRSGCALMEIVSRADMRSADEAKAYVTKLRQIMRYLGTCDGNMEQGSMRADVNVSVRKPGGEFGTRCEIKNVNSIRFIGQAIEYEARRQIGVLEDGGTIDQETRLYDAKKGETRSMRSKEEAHDYRYFPDPDLLPLKLDPAMISAVKASLPELPDDKKARFMSSYNLSAYDAAVLVQEQPSADFFETVAKGRDGKLSANWVVNEFFGRLNKEGKTIDTTPVSAAQIGGIVDLISAGTISGKLAKDLFEIVWTEGGNPADIVQARGMIQVTDMGAIEKAVDEIIAANPDKVEAVKVKASMLGWFVGQVMKTTGGKANPQSVNDLLRQKLNINQ
jgi:aspartyl-tRNA(Asn)/glutamyl-tRNA(Gln) amidotransferase subunit B